MTDFFRSYGGFAAALALALATPAAWAEPQACPAVDLRHRLPPQRDQRLSGWCYAYAAADLASFEWGEEISAVDLALEYGQRKNPRGGVFQGGGSIREALEYGNARGYCRERALVSTDPDESFSGGVDFKLYQIKKYVNRVRQGASLDSLGEAVLRESLRVVFPGLSPSALDPLLRDPALDGEQVILSLRERACEGDRFRPGRAWTIGQVLVPEAGDPAVIRERQSAAMAAVHRRLSEGHPLGASLEIGMLTASLQGRHAVSIVARELRNGTCKVLIRNSFGSRYRGYLEGIENDAGNAWVDESRLAPALKGVYWLQ